MGKSTENNYKELAKHILITIAFCIILTQFFYTYGDRSARHYIPENAYAVACVYDPDIFTNKPNCRIVMEAAINSFDNEMKRLRNNFDDKILIVDEIEDHNRYNALFTENGGKLDSLFTKYDLAIFTSEEIERHPQKKDSIWTEVKVYLRPLNDEIDLNIPKLDVNQEYFAIDDIEQIGGVINRDRCADFECAAYLWSRICYLKMMMGNVALDDEANLKIVRKEVMDKLMVRYNENKNKKSHFTQCAYILAGYIQVVDDSQIDRVAQELDRLNGGAQFNNWDIYSSFGDAFSSRLEQKYLEKALLYYSRALSDSNLSNGYAKLHDIRFSIIRSLAFLERASFDTLYGNVLLAALDENVDRINSKSGNKEFFIAFAKENVIKDTINANADYTKIIEYSNSKENIKHWAQFRKVWMYFKKNEWTCDTSIVTSLDFKRNTFSKINSIIAKDIDEKTKNNFVYLKMMYYQAIQDPDSARFFAKNLEGKSFNELILTISDYRKIMHREDEIPNE